jgi:hypothetical protein
MGLVSAISDAFAVARGPPARLALLRRPAAAVVGRPFGSQPAVMVCDAGGNRVVDSDSRAAVFGPLAPGGPWAEVRAAVVPAGAAGDSDPAALEAAAAAAAARCAAGVGAAAAPVRRGVAAFAGLCCGAPGEWSLVFYAPVPAPATTTSTATRTTTATPVRVAGSSSLAATGPARATTLLTTRMRTTSPLSTPAPTTPAAAAAAATTRPVAAGAAAAARGALATLRAPPLVCAAPPAALHVAEAPSGATMGADGAALLGPVAVVVEDAAGRWVDAADGVIVTARLLLLPLPAANASRAPAPQPTGESAAAVAAAALRGTIRARAAAGRAVFADLRVLRPAAAWALVFAAPHLSSGRSGPIRVLGPTGMRLLRWPVAAGSGRVLDPQPVAVLCDAAGSLARFAPAGLRAAARLEGGSGSVGGELTGTREAAWAWDSTVGGPAAVFTDLAVKGAYGGYVLAVEAAGSGWADGEWGEGTWVIAPARTPPFDVEPVV